MSNNEVEKPLQAPTPSVTPRPIEPPKDTFETQTSQNPVE